MEKNILLKYWLSGWTNGVQERMPWHVSKRPRTENYDVLTM